MSHLVNYSSVFSLRQMTLQSARLSSLSLINLNFKDMKKKSKVNVPKILVSPNKCWNVMFDVRNGPIASKELTFIIW